MRGTPVAATSSFLRETASESGFVAADRLSALLHITRAELAVATGLSRDAVAKTARVRTPSTQSRAARRHRDPQPGAALGRFTPASLRLVPVAAPALLRRPDR